MGLGAVQNEIFVVSGIEVLNSQCSSITLPSASPTLEPSVNPSMLPTSASSLSPVGNPTVSTALSVQPSDSTATVNDDDDDAGDLTQSGGGSANSMEPTIFVIGALVLLGVIGVIAYCCYKKKKEKMHFDTINMTEWEQYNK